MRRMASMQRIHTNVTGLWHGLGMVACIFVFALADLGATAAAQADPDKLTQAANFQFDAGAPVHKSGLTNSTDFSTAYRADAGTFVGKNKSIGLGLRYDTGTTHFTQANAEAKTQWTDFYAGYRYWIFYPKVIVGYGKVSTVVDDVSLVDALAISRGGGLSLRVAFGGMALALFEFDYLTIASTRDRVATNTMLANRMDADLGVMVRLPWEYLSVYTGYRYRDYRILRASGGETEIETGPYLGFAVGVSP